jgi:putative RNA methylase family UPF0020
MRAVPKTWTLSALGTESTLHQLSPYIGKLKSRIASGLISRYTAKGDTIFDPFCGSGVVPVEALIAGRHAVANDLSGYAAVLTKGKMFMPPSERQAVEAAKTAIARCNFGSASISPAAPLWVRRFFHPRTLREARLLADDLRRHNEWFLLSCLLGILHHQRPGFLSYPSSHLVPYLRDKKFPRKLYPELYRYREIESRLLAKIHRAYKRAPLGFDGLNRRFYRRDATKLVLPQPVDAIVTSPPYMNALDYGRDNRLRLWFLGNRGGSSLDARNPNTAASFVEVMRVFAKTSALNLRPGGHCVLVVGEVTRGSRRVNTGRLVLEAFVASGEFHLTNQMSDYIPDVRRSRRHTSCTKREWVLAFTKKA